MTSVIIYFDHTVGISNGKYPDFLESTKAIILEFKLKTKSHKKKKRSEKKKKRTLLIPGQN